VKVLLLDDVRGVGRRGEIKEVAEGYGRNFLIARNLATTASSSALATHHSKRQQLATNAATRKAKAEDAARRLEGTAIDFFLRTDAGGKAFGSVKPEEVIRAIEDGFGIAPDSISPSEPLKNEGDHLLVVSWKEGASASVTARVLPQS